MKYISLPVTHDTTVPRTNGNTVAVLNNMLFIIIVISFLQGIYTYIPETNHVPSEYIFAAILSLLFMVPVSLVPALVLLYFYVYYYYYYYYYIFSWDVILTTNAVRLLRNVSKYPPNVQTHIPEHLHV